MPADVEHKLAAILSADVVGYSRLISEDQGPPLGRALRRGARVRRR